MCFSCYKVCVQHLIKSSHWPHPSRPSLCFSYLRSSGSGGPCARSTRQTEPNSCSLSLAHQKFPCRALLPWRAWTASRSSRSTVTIAPPTACHLLTPGNHRNPESHVLLTVNVSDCVSSLWFPALISWTSRLTRATRSCDTCCCWPFRNVQRVSDWLKQHPYKTHTHTHTNTWFRFVSWCNPHMHAHKQHTRWYTLLDNLSNGLDLLVSFLCKMDETSEWNGLIDIAYNAESLMTTQLCLPSQSNGKCKREFRG